MIDLYFWPTPNGHKVSIMAEECELDYKLVPVRFGRGDQFTPEFLAISPNNRMPALVDHDPADGSDSVHVFESGAMLQYMAEKTGKFCPADLQGRYHVYEWVHWQMANQGPVFGQNGHFRRAEVKQEYAIQRFGNEVNKLYGVMNAQIRGQDYLCGEYSIADMICWPWTRGHEGQGIDINDFPHVKRWQERMEGRPGVQRALEAAKKFVEAQGEQPKLSEEEQKKMRAMMYNQVATDAQKGE